MAKSSKPVGKGKVQKAPSKPAPKGKTPPAKSTGAKPAIKPSAKPAPAKGAAKPVAKPAPKPVAKAGVPAKAATPKGAPTKGAAAKGAPIKAAAPVKSAPAGKTSAAVKGPAPSAKASTAKPAKGEVPKVEIKPEVAGDASAKKPGGKGITVVPPKPVKKPKPKALEMPVEPLIRPGMKWKPLIASGPKAPPSTGIPGVATPTVFKPDPKAKMNKKELDAYRRILLDKRSELIGDIANMEDEALRQNSGSLSTLPQHMAEQGSDTFEQSLSLDLAQVDRHLLREIEAALKRIDEGTYGICERTGKRIGADRLAELPWARYSIEAAREMERRPSVERSEASVDDDSL